MHNLNYLYNKLLYLFHNTIYNQYYSPSIYHLFLVSTLLLQILFYLVVQYAIHMVIQLKSVIFHQAYIKLYIWLQHRKPAFISGLFRLSYLLYDAAVSVAANSVTSLFCFGLPNGNVPLSDNLCWRALFGLMALPNFNSPASRFAANSACL